jgi:hypothetical protein
MGYCLLRLRDQTVKVFPKVSRGLERSMPIETEASSVIYFNSTTICENEKENHHRKGRICFVFDGGRERSSGRIFGENIENRERRGKRRRATGKSR